VRPERRRELVRQLEWTYRVSERRGCAVLRFNRSSHRYRAIRNDQAALTGRIRELAAARVRYGYFRIYILLRRGRLEDQSQARVPAVSPGGAQHAA